MKEISRSLVGTFNLFGSLAQPEGISETHWKTLIKVAVAVQPVKGSTFRSSLQTPEGTFVVYEAIKRLPERPKNSWRKPDPLWDVYRIETAPPVSAQS